MPGYICQGDFSQVFLDVVHHQEVIRQVDLLGDGAFQGAVVIAHQVGQAHGQAADQELICVRVPPLLVLVHAQHVFPQGLVPVGAEQQVSQPAPLMHPLGEEFADAAFPSDEGREHFIEGAMAQEDIVDNAVLCKDFHGVKGTGGDKADVPCPHFQALQADALGAVAGADIGDFKKGMAVQESGGIAVVPGQKDAAAIPLGEVFAVLHVIGNPVREQLGYNQAALQGLPRVKAAQEGLQLLRRLGGPVIVTVKDFIFVEGNHALSCPPKTT